VAAAKRKERVRFERVGESRLASVVHATGGRGTRGTVRPKREGKDPYRKMARKEEALQSRREARPRPISNEIFRHREGQMAALRLVKGGRFINLYTLEFFKKGGVFGPGVCPVGKRNG